MAQAQRKKKQQQQVRPKSTAQKAVALVVVVVALAGTIAIGLSSGTSAPSVDDDNGAIITGQFQDVTVTGTALPTLPREGSDPALDTAAPTLSGYDFRGNPISVNTPEDTRNTLLVFLAHWCPHCNEEVPRLVEWREKGLIPDNLRVVGIATGSRNDAPNWPPSDWFEEKKWPFEVMADSEEQTAAVAYGLSAYPFMAVVDAEGILRTRFSGQVETTALTEIINAALS